jgi:hypothetical protein
MSIEDDYNKLTSMYAAAKAEVTLLGKELSTCHVYAKQIRESRDAEIARLRSLLSEVAAVGKLGHWRGKNEDGEPCGPGCLRCRINAVLDQIGDQG